MYFMLLCLVLQRAMSSNLIVGHRLRALDGYYSFGKDNYRIAGDPSGAPVSFDEDVMEGESSGEFIGQKGQSGIKDTSAVRGKDTKGNDNSGGSRSSSYGSKEETSFTSKETSTYSKSASGSNSYGGADSYYNYGSSSFSGSGTKSQGGDASYHPPNEFSSKVNSILKDANVSVPLLPAVLVAIVILYCGMVCTAFMYQARPRSTFTNCCRLTVNCIRSVFAIASNLYYCRLGDIPPIVCAMDDEGDLTDEELARMKPRPGIEKALQIEHQKAILKAEHGSDAKVFG